jgi:hypothetical protein
MTASRKYKFPEKSRASFIPFDKTNKTKYIAIQLRQNDYGITLKNDSYAVWIIFS